MALKMDRQVDAVDISYFLNEVAERGVIVSVNTAGSGVAMDNPSSLATVAGASSGSKPLGLLLNDFVNVDQTRQEVNWFKDQQQIGDKCTILTKGWVVTNKLVGSPTAGQLAAVASSGSITGVAVGTGSTANQPIVGRFRSSKDEAGYAKVYIDL
jgi:putative N-acetylmannosamine-6-phosphate epimerase